MFFRYIKSRIIKLEFEDFFAWEFKGHSRIRIRVNKILGAGSEIKNRN